MKKGWQIKKLGEICEMYQPKTITGKELVKDGAYPVYGANGVIGRYNQFNHEEPWACFEKVDEERRVFG
jgi:hypothetical protein